MPKEKIAISLEKSLLSAVDKKVDGSMIRSRSQAIEFYLSKGLDQEKIDTAVIMLKGSQQEVALKKIDGKSLIMHQLEMLNKNGIKFILILTQKSSKSKALIQEVSNSGVPTKIVERSALGNAEALSKIKDSLSKGFVAMSGDVLNDFNLKAMMEEHAKNNTITTMALMTPREEYEYGEAVLEGSKIIEFGKKQDRKHHVVNAGAYIFNNEIFKYLDSSKSLEKEVFPKLARERQLSGFFIHGRYEHFK